MFGIPYDEGAKKYELDNFRHEFKIDKILLEQ